VLAICNWIQTEWLNLYFEYTYERKKRQICQVITQGFSKEYKLTVDVSDVVVCAVFFQEGKDDIDLPNCYFVLKHWQRPETLIHNWKQMTCLSFIFEAIMMYISSIRGVR
jgi:hypothetical protein